jgi:glycosyltransferase involved in cell wall biosynthesis
VLTDAWHPGATARPEADRRLRVVQVVCGTAFAGTEKHVLALATQLRLLGCDAEIACPESAGRLRSEALRAAVPLRAPLRLARGEQPDVVHVHDGRSAIIGWAVARRAGAALVRTQHFVRPASVERTGLSGRLSVGLHRLINRRLDGYICVSGAAAQAARARRDVTRVACTVIPPGVAIPSSPEVESAVAARSVAPHPVVLSAGRLEPERRFDVLLDAIPTVLRVIPDCEFLIAGAGSAEADLKARALSLGVESSVTWAGWLPDLGPAMAGAHVYVNTWPWEGFGMATAEAMGFALPVIATGSGASPELVEDGVSGRLVEPADAAALATALIELLTDRDGSAALGLEGRERAVSRYSLRATAESTLALYSRIARVQPGS